MLSDNSINVNGSNLKILFNFKLNDIDYLVYQNEKNEISASRVIFEGNDMILDNITDDVEWENVQKKIDMELGR